MPDKIQKLFLSILSGILLSLPFHESFSGLFLFIGLVPLLILENRYHIDKGLKSHEVFWYSLLSFSIWNIATTWWIGYATLIGASALIAFNSLLYSLVFWFFHYSKRLLSIKPGNYILIIYWLTFEFIYLRTEISWPWLDLGNGFAKSIELVQWYEYTGILGGTLWALLINILISEIICEFVANQNFRISKNKIWFTLIIIIVPTAYSLDIYYSYQEKSNPCKVVVIQPNIDPYWEKFTGISPKDQLHIILKEASKKGNLNIDYFVAPETSIQGYNIENEFDFNWATSAIKNFVTNYPQSRFVIGAETVREYKLNEEQTYTAQKNDDGIWIDRYNSALQIDTGKQIQVYHKSQLVIGVEKTPFSKYLSFLKKYSIKIGGTAGGLGSQESRETFTSTDSSEIAPIICYESVYGEYVSDYVKAGANLLFIITNDGWWKNTEGMRQHLHLSQLRAIETRRSVARSANTGISALINQRGDILQFINWNERTTIAGELNKNQATTFYVRYGDFLGRIAMYLCIGIIIWIIWTKIKIRSKNEHSFNSIH
jgi:apolipoprotein N-acyltransferase